MMVSGILRQWLKLARLQSGAATAITGVFGAILLMPKHEVDIVHLIMVFIIGLLSHFYGFSLNEYADIEIDKYSRYLSEKPLVAGTIEKKHALYAAIVSVSIAIALAIVFFKNVWALATFLAAIVMGAIYDLFGKRFFGADFVLGSYIFLFTIFGGLTVSSELSPAIFVVAFLFFIQLSFQTGVTGGMKDIPHDHLAKAKTSPVYLGCRVYGNRLVVTKEFRAYAYITKAVHTTVILLPFWLGLFVLYQPVIVQLAILLLLVLLMWATTAKALSLKTFERTSLMRLLGAQEIATYPMVPILVMGVIGVLPAQFLLLFPIIWLAFFLYVIYGKFMPDV